MATFRPAGFEDDEFSDDDGFTFGDSYVTNEVGFRETTSSNRVNSSIDPPGRGGFGQPPVKKPTRSAPPRLDGASFRQNKSAPKSQPVVQRSSSQLSGSKKNLTNTAAASTSTMLENTPSWTTMDTVLVDDFRMAVIRNNVEAVQSYLDQGLPVDTIFTTKWTALMYAANNAQPDVVQLLLDKGADVNYNKDMYTVLMAACCSPSETETDILNCVNILLDKGADINSYDRYHMNAVMYAVKKKRNSVVKRLIEAGINVEKQDNKGHTALMTAASMGHVRIVQTLLDAGADVNKQSTDGSKAADMAYVQGHKQIEELIKTKELPGQSNSAAIDIVEDNEDIASEELTNKMSMKSLQSGSSQEIYRYGDLELFLTGLELPELIQVFSDHKVKFHELLRMTDHDLQQMGIHQIGVRKKILDGIRDTHKKSWETSSISEVQYNKKITCAEAIAMVTNIKRHAKYIGSSVGYISDQIIADQNILVNTQDGSGTEELSIQTEETITNITHLYKELIVLREHLTKVGGLPHYQPADLIRPKVSKQIVSPMLSFTTVLLGVGFCGLACYKRTSILEGIKTVFNKILVH